MRLLAGFVVLAVTALLLSFGCAALKKQCDTPECVWKSLRNDCEEAVHTSNFEGRIAKTETFASGATCTLVSDLHSKDGKKLYETTCTYQRPVNDASNSTCKYWDYRVDK